MNPYEANIMSGISCLGDYESRSISPENFTGEKGKGGMATEGTGASCAQGLGQGWKISPSVSIPAHSTFTMANISGEGSIRHIWLTPVGNFRFYIIRIYWDGSELPSVECPLSDFFAATHIPEINRSDFHQVSSLAVCVNPRFGLNCYWNMPFRKSCRITVENLADEDRVLYYQIDYVLGAVPENAGYFHARFRRVHSLPYKRIKRYIPFSMESKATGSMSEPISFGVQTAAAGGEKGKSNSTSTETVNIPRYAAPERKIISAGRIILTTTDTATFPPPIPAFP